MAKPIIPIDFNKEYGWLTVLKEVPKDRFGHYRYLARCRCGNEFEINKKGLLTLNPKCKECSNKYGVDNLPRSHHEGEIINGFKVLKKVGKSKKDAWLYECQCLKCGYIKIIDPNQLKLRKGNGCDNCCHEPVYDIEIYGDTASVILNGKKVLFDAKDVEFFKQFHWYINDSGYVERRNINLPKLKLHWLSYGYTSKPPIIIDHISRDKLDNRSCNLRSVNNRQNSYNHSMLSTNKSGYTGVFKNGSKWHSFIYHNGRHIHFGNFDDIVFAAQCYNVACKILRGEYAGELNDVPEATDEVKQLVKTKLLDNITIVTYNQATKKLIGHQSGGLF